MCLPSKLDVRPSWVIRSSSVPSPRRYPKRAFGRMYGAFDIDSMPPVTTTSTSPARIIESAISTALTDDAQTLLIVSLGVSIGSPPPIAACRAGACPAPPCRTWPMITYCGSWGSMPARSSAAPTAIDPSSVAGRSASPPPRRPNGVRTALTMTLLVTTSKLAQEARLGREPPREGDDEADRRLDVVEDAELDRRVHVPHRHRDEPRRDARPHLVHRVRVGERAAGLDLEEVRDPLLLGCLREEIGDAGVQHGAAADRDAAAEIDLPRDARVAARHVGRERHVDRERDIRAERERRR